MHAPQTHVWNQHFTFDSTHKDFQFRENLFGPFCFIFEHGHYRPHCSKSWSLNFKPFGRTYIQHVVISCMILTIYIFMKILCHMDYQIGPIWCFLWLVRNFHGLVHMYFIAPLSRLVWLQIIQTSWSSKISYCAQLSLFVLLIYVHITIFRPQYYAATMTYTGTTNFITMWCCIGRSTIIWIRSFTGCRTLCQLCYSVRWMNNVYC